MSRLAAPAKMLRDKFGRLIGGLRERQIVAQWRREMRALHILQESMAREAVGASSQGQLVRLGKFTKDTTALPHEDPEDWSHGGVPLLKNDVAGRFGPDNTKSPKASPMPDPFEQMMDEDEADWAKRNPERFARVVAMRRRPAIASNAANVEGAAGLQRPSVLRGEALPGVPGIPVEQDDDDGTGAWQQRADDLANDRDDDDDDQEMYAAEDEGAYNALGEVWTEEDGFPKYDKSGNPITDSDGNPLIELEGKPEYTGSHAEPTYAAEDMDQPEFAANAGKHPAFLAHKGKINQVKQSMREAASVMTQDEKKVFGLVRAVAARIRQHSIDGAEVVREAMDDRASHTKR
jgi:hypothetical protein